MSPTTRIVAAAAAGVLATELRHHRVAVRLRREAHTDSLTGLLNRAGIGAHLDAALAKRPPVGMLLVDLDDFKPVNDEHGHHAGDLVLKVVAGRLRAALLPGEYASRHGGDEFSVLVAVPELAWVRRRAAAIATAVAGPVVLPSGCVVQIRASVGHAIAADAAALWEAADDAMYVAKRAHHAATPVRSTRVGVA